MSKFLSYTQAIFLRLRFLHWRREGVVRRWRCGKVVKGWHWDGKQPYPRKHGGAEQASLLAISLLRLPRWANEMGSKYREIPVVDSTSQGVEAITWLTMEPPPPSMLTLYGVDNCYQMRLIHRQHWAPGPLRVWLLTTQAFSGHCTGHAIKLSCLSYDWVFDALLNVLWWGQAYYWLA